MSGSAISASALLGLTEPPYWIRIAPAVAPPNRSVSRLRMCAWTSCACAGVAVRPVPIAQTGSYAITSRCAATSRVDAVEAARELRVDDLERAAAVALGERLADAHDRAEAAGERGARLLADALVGVAEELAALAVADDRPRRAGVGEQRRARPRR